MKYRRFGKTELQVSALGFGCMRFPTKGSIIDESLATEMIRKAIDNGVNYIDTAYPYHGKNFSTGGQSEPFLKKALADGYREKVYLATKLPVWLVRSYEDMDRYLDEQLDRLGVDCIDLYLLHALDGSQWRRINKLNVGKFLDKAIESGKIKYAGFSYHGPGDNDFNQIIDGYDFSFCQIQFNYLDEDYQAGLAGLEYAASKDLGITIMEPLRGGNLINVPVSVQNMFDDNEVKRSNAEWGLRWIWNHKEIGAVLSGMSAMEHVDDNLMAASRSGIDVMTEDELNMFDKIKGIMKSNQAIGCTACKYCMPCPAGVNIPEVFKYYNEFMRAEDEYEKKEVIWKYHEEMPESEKASNCVQCGKCEQHCPQRIRIRMNMRVIALSLAE